MNSKRLTQREIAKRAGVSQATVSTVLSGREDTSARISAETRARVQAVIDESTYVADPAARRLHGLDNRILGVFTYESTRSEHSMEFYEPFLTGIEGAAERLGCDLLFFTSAPLEDGVRSFFHQGARFRLSDGCVLLGRQMPSADLRRLADEGYPFVAIGRREEAAVPYVGVDYKALTSRILRRASELGHTHALYLADTTQSPSDEDRSTEVKRVHESGLLDVAISSAASSDIDAAVKKARQGEVTLLVTTGSLTAVRLIAALADASLSVPDDVSVVTLGQVRKGDAGRLSLAGFSTPRAEMGSRAIDLLQQIITTPESEGQLQGSQVLLEGDVVFGESLGKARGGVKTPRGLTSRHPDSGLLRTTT